MSPDYVQLLPRRPVEVPLNEDEENFFRGLEIVIEQNLDPTDFGRRAAKEAVQLTFTYLNRRGLSGQAMQPLTDVFMAFQDVENGVLPELFDPKAGSNSGPNGLNNKWSRSSAAGQIKIYAAACMAALMKTGLRKEDAAIRVERAAQSWPKFSSGIIKASTATNWRDELMQRSTTDPDRLIYERLVCIFTDGPNAAQYLDEVLHKGPPLTGGIRRSETSSET